MKKTFAAIAAMIALEGLAAPLKDVVADGFAAWEGIDDKNYIAGRRLTPSDLRHRTVFVVHLDANALHAQFIATGGFIISSLGFPSGMHVDWDSLDEFPRDNVALAVIHGACDKAKYLEALKFPTDKEPDKAESTAVGAFGKTIFVGIYGEKAKLSGAEDPTVFPTVQVILPGETKVAWSGKFSTTSAKTVKEVKGIIAKGKAASSSWRQKYGVAEVKYWKAAEKIIAEGKKGYGERAQAALLKGIKDKDPEKAKEAQVMYDALAQYRDDLAFRIEKECAAAPMRAFADMQELLMAFPAEKKMMKAIEAKFKQNRIVSTVGKMLVDYLTWNDPDFTFRSASEAKSASQKVVGWKKQLEAITVEMSKKKEKKTPLDTALEGEVQVLLSVLDGFSDSLLSKVPQK